MAWESWQIAELNRMWANGVPVPEIARIVGKDASTVCRQRAFLKLPPRQKRTPYYRAKGAKVWSPADIKRLQALWPQGLTYKQMGRELNRTAKAVEIRAAFLGLPRRRQDLQIRLDVNVPQGLVDKLNMAARQRGLCRADLIRALLEQGLTSAH